MGPQSKAIWDKSNKSNGKIIRFPKPPKAASEGGSGGERNIVQDSGPAYVFKSDLEAFQLKFEGLVDSISKTLSDKLGTKGLENPGPVNPLAWIGARGQCSPSLVHYLATIYALLFSQTAAEGDDEFDEEEGDSASQVSSWNYKRVRKDPGEEYADLVIADDQDNSEKVAPSSWRDEKVTDRYVATLTNAIKDFNIEGAETKEVVASTLKSTRAKRQKPGALVSFKSEHIEVVQHVWDKDPSELGIFTKIAHWADELSTDALGEMLSIICKIKIK